MKNTINLLFIFLLFLAACDKNDGNDVISTSPVPIQLDSFPLAIGNTWKYHTEINIMDSSGQIFSASYYDNFWTIQSDTIINGLTAYKIQQVDSNYNGTVNVGYSYYSNQPDGFYGVGVENFGSMLELKESIQFDSGSIFDFSQPDTIFIPLTPIQFLKFPSHVSDSWYSIVHLGTDTLFTNKTYIKFKTVNTNAGTFDCIRLQSNRIMNGVLETNHTIFQDFGHKGLIGEAVYVDSLYFGGSYGKLTRTTKLVQINF